MDAALRFVTEVTRARRVERGQRIQTLWGGYGELFRVELEGGDAPSAIVKWVKPPAQRGKRSDRSHARKCRSYDVETAWYRTYAARCDETCRVPKLLGSRVGKDEWLLVLEDLDAAGFAGRARRDGSLSSAQACLAWLAAFHARFLGADPTGLWKTGTYWHLATRPDELAMVEDEALRSAAPTLDRMLSACTFKTFVHGDAKLPNFCFSREDASDVAAVDFQYVGGGCGMKDVAYLIAGEPAESRHLDYYFARLREHVTTQKRLEGVGDIDPSRLESEWRELYPIACADFYRFLAGWAPDAWRRDSHGQEVARTVLASLGAKR